MQHIQRYRPFWLVVLMVFAIGCSAVSNAFAQSMHTLMAATSSAHCMQMVDSSGHQQQGPQQHDTVTADLHSSMTCLTGHDMVQSVTHNQCTDCTTLSCQWSNLAVVNAEITFADVVDHVASKDLNTTYQAQHLAGHIQEILRPPRA